MLSYIALPPSEYFWFLKSSWGANTMDCQNIIVAFHKCYIFLKNCLPYVFWWNIIGITDQKRLNSSIMLKKKPTKVSHIVFNKIVPGAKKKDSEATYLIPGNQYGPHSISVPGFFKHSWVVILLTDFIALWMLHLYFI